MGFEVPDTERCIRECIGNSRCVAVVVTPAETRVRCWRRSWVDLTACDRAYAFNTYILTYPPSPPAAPPPPSHPPWVPTSCNSECVRNTLRTELIPVVSAANAHTHVAWHAYLERVYHQSLGNRSIDLSTFSWYYRDRRSYLIEEPPCTTICTITLYDGSKRDGTPWLGNQGPEGPDGAGHYGFFVHRPYIRTEDATTCERLEVFHVRTTWAGGETGVSWFFHTVGSGVYIDCNALRSRGRIVGYHDRGETSGDRSMGTWMRQNGLAMAI